MPRPAPPREQMLAFLAEVPAQLAVLTAGLSAEALRKPHKPGAWSSVDILAHIHACAEVAGEAMHRILAEDHPKFPAANPRAWAEAKGYRQREFRALLGAFRRHRAELMGTLHALPPDAWLRTASVKGSGPAQVKTLDSYIAWMWRHEGQHVGEVGKNARRARKGSKGRGGIKGGGLRGRKGLRGGV